MRIKMVGLRWLLLLGGFAVVAPLPAQELKPRLGGIVHFGSVNYALPELSERNRKEFPRPMQERDAQGYWTIMHLDPARRSVTVSNLQNGTIRQLGFTNAAPAGKAPPTFQF